MHFLQGLSHRKLLFPSKHKKKGRKTFMTLIGTFPLNGVIVFMRKKERNYNQTSDKRKSWQNSNSLYLVEELSPSSFLDK